MVIRGLACGPNASRYYPSWRTGGLLLVASLFLSGCASNLENAAKLLAERPQQTCTETVDGVEVSFQGAACDRLADAAAKQKAMSACAGFAEANEPLCVLALVMNGNQGQSSQDSEIALLQTAMQADTQIKAAYISAIPGLGQILATTYQAHQSEKTLRTAFKNSGTRVGTVNVSKSDDGGDAMSGEGAATGGSGGNGDQYVTIGNRNQTIPGDGSIITEGRNPVLIGTGQPDSSLDPSTVNNSNQTAPNNATNNAPVVETSDDDGGQSIIPSF